MNRKHLKIFSDLLSLPTAPLHEHRVVAYIRDFSEKRGLPVKEDRFGNLIVRYTRGKPSPVALTAHTDHPGFTVHDVHGRQLEAEWLGGHDRNHFPGSRVLIQTHDGPVTGRVSSTIGKTRRFEITARRRIQDIEGAYGYWNLPPFHLDGDRITTKAADNLVGCAAILAALDNLFTQKEKADLYAVFTRAEEVGLVGAAGLVEAKTLPKRIPIIVLETSKELPGALIGNGPVIRVGDYMSIFDPSIEYTLHDLAKGIASADRQFAFQRQLMSGGVCEASIYVLHGYQVGALAFPLGNYHNESKRWPAPEYISRTDARNMIRLCTEIALHPPEGDTRDPMRKYWASRYADFRQRVLDSR